MSAICIRRPVMTILVMASFVIAGIFGYKQLPVAAVPRVDFPTIQVQAQLPGASPETMAASVASILERQFSNLYKEASRQKGVTGENLLRMLEQRLDNIVFRAGWASTRPQARQFVSHGMVNVNGRRVDIPSYRVRKGDVISLRDKPRNMIVIRHNMDTIDRLKPSWIELGDSGFQVTVNDLPTREQIDVPVREQLIVELYSK